MIPNQQHATKQTRDQSTNTNRKQQKQLIDPLKKMLNLVPNSSAKITSNNNSRLSAAAPANESTRRKLSSQKKSQQEAHNIASAVPEPQATSSTRARATTTRMQASQQPGPRVTSSSAGNRVAASDSSNNQAPAMNNHDINLVPISESGRRALEAASANELAKCYQEIDQIYDYIRGLAPLPLELRKIKWIDFEKEEKMSRERRQHQLTTMQHQHQLQQRAIVGEQPPSKRLLALRVTGGSVTPQVKRVESFNLNQHHLSSDPTAVAGSMKNARSRQATPPPNPMLESVIRLPRAQSGSSSSRGARALDQATIPMIDSRPDSRSGRSACHSRQPRREPASGSRESPRPHESDSSQTTSSSSRSEASSSSASSSASDSTSASTATSDTSTSDSQEHTPPRRATADRSFASRLHEHRQRQRDRPKKLVSATTSASSRANEKSTSSGSPIPSSSTTNNELNESAEASDYDNNNESKSHLHSSQSGVVLSRKNANKTISPLEFAPPKSEPDEQHIYEQIIPAKNEPTNSQAATGENKQSTQDARVGQPSEAGRRQPAPFMYPLAFGSIRAAGPPKPHRHQYLDQRPPSANPKTQARPRPATSMNRVLPISSHFPTASCLHAAHSLSRLNHAHHSALGQQASSSQFLAPREQLVPELPAARDRLVRSRQLSMNNLNLVPVNWSSINRSHPATTSRPFTVALSAQVPFSTSFATNPRPRLRAEPGSHAHKTPNAKDSIQANNSQFLSTSLNGSRTDKPQPTAAASKRLSLQQFIWQPSRLQPAPSVTRHPLSAGSLPRHHSQLASNVRPLAGQTRATTQGAANFACSSLGSVGRRRNARRLTALGIEQEALPLTTSARGLLGFVEAPLIDDEPSPEQHQVAMRQQRKNHNPIPRPLNSVSSELNNLDSSLESSSGGQQRETAPMRVDEPGEHEQRRSGGTRARSASSRQRKSARSPDRLFESSSSFIKCYYGRADEVSDEATRVNSNRIHKSAPVSAASVVERRPSTESAAKSAGAGERLLGLIGLSSNPASPQPATESRAAITSLRGRLFHGSANESTITPKPEASPRKPRVYEHPMVSLPKLPASATNSETGVRKSMVVNSSRQQQVNPAAQVSSSLRKKLANVLTLRGSSPSAGVHEKTSIANLATTLADEEAENTHSDSTSSYEAAIKRGQRETTSSGRVKPTTSDQKACLSSAKSPSSCRQATGASRAAAYSNASVGGTLMKVPKLSRQSHLLSRPLPKPPGSRTAAAQVATLRDDRARAPFHSCSSAIHHTSPQRATLHQRHPATNSLATVRNQLTTSARKPTPAGRLVSTHLQPNQSQAPPTLERRHPHHESPNSIQSNQSAVASSQPSRRTSDGSCNDPRARKGSLVGLASSSSTSMSPLAVAITSQQQHSSPTVTTCTSSGISSRLTSGTHNNATSTNSSSLKPANNRDHSTPHKRPIGGSLATSAGRRGRAVDSPSPEFALMDDDDDEQENDDYETRAESDAKSTRRSRDLFGGSLTNELESSSSDGESRSTNEAHSSSSSSSRDSEPREEDDLRRFDEKFACKQRYFDQQLASSRDSLLESMNLVGANQTASTTTATSKVAKDTQPDWQLSRPVGAGSRPMPRGATITRRQCI